MNRFTFLVAAMAACVMVAPVARSAEVANPATSAMVQQIDSMRFEDLVTRTAGTVDPSRIGKYAGDFDEYWKRARVNFEGKTFEAIVADTTNARNKAVREATRLVPNAMLGNHTAPADLLLVKSPGAAPTLVQAKLGTGGVLEALGDAKYRGMEIVTCRESFDELVARLKKEAAKAARRGLPLTPEYQRLQDAIESGRVWKKLPCGAPLPERSYVEAVSRSHCQRQWTTAAKQLAGVTDDTARAVSAAVRGASDGTAAGTAKAARVAKEAAAQAGGAADDVVATLGKTVVRWAGPVATVYEVGSRGYRVYTTEAKFAAGEISQVKREVEHAGNAGGAAGGIGGATGGAWGGAAVGSMIFPGIGTVAGGVVGGIGGAIGGSYAGQVAAEAAMDAVHATGTTVRAAAGWTGNRLYQAYRWATPW